MLEYTQEFISRNAYPDYKLKRAASAGLFNMPQNSIIIQTKGKTRKTALPFGNQEHILYQFFEFTQNLKRSLEFVKFTPVSMPKNCGSTDFISFAAVFLMIITLYNRVLKHHYTAGLTPNQPSIASL